MFSGTISGLLGKSAENELRNKVQLTQGSLCHLLYERCRWTGWLEMGTVFPLNIHSTLILTNYQVFILEGLPAIFCGIHTFFYLPDCE